MRKLRQYLIKRLYANFRVHPGQGIGVVVSPCFCLNEIVKLSYNQASAKAGRTGIFAVDRWMGSRQKQSSFVAQRFQSGNMSGPGLKARFKTVFPVNSHNRVVH